MAHSVAHFVPIFYPALTDLPSCCPDRSGPTPLGEKRFVVAVAKIIEPKPVFGNARAIDAEHLARMTLGERSLEREVLALFDRQAEMLLPRIRRGDRAVAAASAHTLKGSAVGIGAFGVARAAEAVERAQESAQDSARRDAAFAQAIETLAAVLEETKAEIARLLAN
jgi:HPt (histidine-containing phosphotransfer) domain-containing protein